MIWSDVSMDFTVGMPKGHRCTTIFAVVNRLSKYSHFFQLQRPYTAKDIAKVVFDGGIP